MLVGEGASDALDEDVGKIELCVVCEECMALCAGEFWTPEGADGAAEKNMPVGFGDVEAGGEFVVCGAFDAMHVSSSREMVVSKFHDEDLCAVL